MGKYPDFNLLQERLARSTQKSNPWALKIEKPKIQGTKNSETVRILPNLHNKDAWYFTEAWFHYNVGNVGTVPCVKMNDMEPCAVCAHIDAIYAKADDIAHQNGVDKRDTEGKRRIPEIAQLWAVAKQIKKKKRVYAPVVVRGKESEGPKFFGMSPTLYEDLFAYVTTRKKNYLDPYAGFDCVISFKNDESDFGKYTFDFITDDGASPALSSGDKKEIDALIESVPDIWSSLLEKKSSEEVSRIMSQITDIQTGIPATGREGHSAITGSVYSPNPSPNPVNERLDSEFETTIDDLKSMLEN